MRLNELTQVDIHNLTEFAECSLAVKGQNPTAGEDITQRALLAILRGLEMDQGGRMPRLVDMEIQGLLRIGGGRFLADGAPEAERPVPTPRRQGVAVGRECHSFDDRRESLDRESLLAGNGVPEPDRPAFTASGDHSAIR